MASGAARIGLPGCPNKTKPIFLRVQGVCGIPGYFACSGPEFPFPEASSRKKMRLITKKIPSIATPRRMLRVMAFTSPKRASPPTVAIFSITS